MPQIKLPNGEVHNLTDRQLQTLNEVVESVGYVYWWSKEKRNKILAQLLGGA